jgi:hypothetical protein
LKAKIVAFGYEYIPRCKRAQRREERERRGGMREEKA